MLFWWFDILTAEPRPRNAGYVIDVARWGSNWSKTGLSLEGVTARVALMHSDEQKADACCDLATLQAEKRYAILDDRNNLFGSHIFSDPAWHILIDLFIAHKKGCKYTVSDVCVGSKSPLATCLRYISILSDASLVTRERDPSDKRRVFVTLTCKAVTLLTKLLDKESNRLREFAVPFDHFEP